METIIGGNIYQHSKVPQWTNTTVEHILGQLTKMNKPFKYIGKEDSKYHRRTLFLRSRALFPFHSSRTRSSLFLAVSRTFPFAVPVTCVIMEKNGAGLHTATSCYWDNTTDGGYAKLLSQLLRPRISALAFDYDCPS
ncbi:unnamed protein product [Ixodes persulcatus]